MESRTIEEGIQVATMIAREKSEAIYGYYLRLRPPAPGAHPGGEILTVSLAFRTWHENICDEIWGWVCYARPLTLQEVEDYELLPDEDNLERYQQYRLVRTSRVTDATGKTIVNREYIMGENGKPYTTSYKRKALVKLDELNKQYDGEAYVKIVKVAQKKATDGAPT